MSATAVSRTPSERAALDRAIAELREHTGDLVRTPVAAKAALLRECIPRLAGVAAPWVEAGCRAKGLPPGASAEEWLAGPGPTVRGARLLADSLQAIAEQGRPPLGTGSRRGAHGRLLVDLFPVSG